MTNIELKNKAIEFFNKDYFIVEGVENINYKPHPFTIGSEHIGKYKLDTSKPCVGYTNNEGEYSNNRKKGFTKCGLSIKEHTSDTVVFLKLVQNLTQDIAKEQLQGFINSIHPNIFSGYAFVETIEKFRIK